MLCDFVNIRFLTYTYHSNCTNELYNVLKLLLMALGDVSMYNIAIIVS